MKIALFILWSLCLLSVAALALVPNLMAMHNGADKMLHLCVFCILMLWPTMTFEKPRFIAVALITLVCIGIGIEAAQIYIPSRNPEIMDMAYNVLGIISGLIIGYLLRESYQSLLPLARAHTHMKQTAQNR